MNLGLPSITGRTIHIYHDQQLSIGFMILIGAFKTQDSICKHKIKESLKNNELITTQ
jgi:hypothetical protein